ncbi:hypothetical protein [Pusillimonas sp. NJUB218]|uniref:hypothetical protein n=1 Tax=Pusillimonas sp. NJUB218 TaxID=2023230 RepID=UPI000F4CC3A7|nr:hypothetical protein [Pusillimonas sp. NJUB218]ROT46092.1 hypothetical protein CHR62_03700 [Pusillimonas sp. NJUB218]
MTNENRSNVIFLASGRTVSPKNNVFLDLASQLIADHATPIDTKHHQQQITGDNNLQRSSNPAAQQSIAGNWNIQISGHNPELDVRLAAIERLLKKT